MAGIPRCEGTATAFTAGTNRDTFRARRRQGLGPGPPQWNSPFAFAFSAHENSGRKPQHDPARCRHFDLLGRRVRRHAGGTARHQDGAPCRQALRLRRAVSRPTNHPRQPGAAGPNRRRAIRAEHPSTRSLSISTLHRRHLVPVACSHMHADGRELSPFCHLARKSAGVIHRALPFACFHKSGLVE